MKTRPLGSTGARIPVVGLGTWEMEKSPDASVEALRRGIEIGATHIDTAEMYGSGEVERIVGRAIRDRRARVFLVSKVLPSNASYDGTLEACERSLNNLGTDRLDLYLLHWPGDHPLAETFRAFERLVSDGKIRFFGVSNFDVQEMEEALALSPAVACNQVLYHLKERAIEHELLPACARRNVSVVAYSPFGQGDFPDAPVLRDIAGERGVTVRQIALAFLLRNRDLFVIPKSSRVNRVEENAGAADLELTTGEIARIDAALLAKRRRGLPTL